MMKRSKPSRRRGAALVMALFALGVAATAGTAFVKTRSGSVEIGSNMAQAAQSRLAAAEGLALSREMLARIFQEPDATLAAQWRASLSDGVLLQNYTMSNGAVLNVTISDVATGAAPGAATTEFEAGITVTIGGTSYGMTAQLSLQSLVKGQYAIFANKLMTMEGDNFIGRWERAPSSEQELPINIGTQAERGWFGLEGVELGTGAYFEGAPVDVPGTQASMATAIASQSAAVKRAARAGVAHLEYGTSDLLFRFNGGNPLVAANWEALPDSYEYDIGAYLHHPYGAESVTVSGGSADEVDLVRMPQGQSARPIQPPAEPTFAGGTTITGNKSYSATTVTLNPTRIKCNEFFGIPIGGGDLNIVNGSTVTLNSGVYRVDDKLKLENSKLIINGNVKIVMKARMWFDLDARSFTCSNSTIELKENSQLLLFVAYDMAMANSWVGKDWTCASESNASLKQGDPHKKAWMGQWQANACSDHAPAEPQYMEPWRVRIYPDPAFLSSIFLWDFNNCSVIGSIFMPTNPVWLRGTTEIYGRICANHVIMRNSASFFYDHALDDITGLTEGAPPPRGGSQSIPTRIRVDF